MPILYLIPVPLVENGLATIPSQTIQAIHGLTHFLAEKSKTARHFIKTCQHPLPQSELFVEELDKHNKNKLSEETISWMEKGITFGFMSEAGCPGVADPGQWIASIARSKNYQIKPLVGPSSLLLALMASGMEGQRFTFHGYLPVDKSELTTKLHEIERNSANNNETQIWIETPYRNSSMLEHAIKILQPTTLLGIAVDLTGENELTMTHDISNWKLLPIPEMHKIPTVFTMMAMKRN